MEMRQMFLKSAIKYMKYVCEQKILYKNVRNGLFVSLVKTLNATIIHIFAPKT